MKVNYEYPTIVHSIRNAIDMAKIENRDIKSIELSAFEWDEFKSWAQKFYPANLLEGQALFEGVTIKRTET